LFRGEHRFGGEEIPGFASITWTRNHQRERTFIVGQMDGERDDPRLAFTSSTGITDQAMVPGMFAPSDFPAFLFASIGSNQMVAEVPTHDKTQMMIQGECRLRTASKTAIPDVENFSTP
jgi:hypothetical protein